MMNQCQRAALYRALDQHAQERDSTHPESFRAHGCLALILHPQIKSKSMPGSAHADLAAMASSSLQNLTLNFPMHVSDERMGSIRSLAADGGCQNAGLCKGCVRAWCGP